MLHPRLGPAVSPGRFPFLESAISVSAVQGAVPRSQPAVPSIKLLASVVGQYYLKEIPRGVFIVTANATPIVVRQSVTPSTRLQTMILMSALVRQLWVQHQASTAKPLSSAGQEIAGAARFIVNKLNLLSFSICLDGSCCSCLHSPAQATLAHSMQRGVQYVQGMLSCKSRDDAQAS
ncbi:hypothetical protein WJX77_006318 [Trebouxia sp. C0004]